MSRTEKRGHYALTTLRCYLFSRFTRTACQSNPARGYRRRLFLEALEDRRTPATFTVNALTDTGAGSALTGDLRYCITQANSNPGSDTITFSVTGTITLNGTKLPALSDTIGVTTIEGGTPGITIDGDNKLGTLVQINDKTTASLNHLTFSHASGTDLAGISNAGALALVQCNFTNNKATATISVTGIRNTGALTLTGTTFSNNTASGTSASAGVSGSGTLTMADVGFTNNTASGTVAVAGVSWSGTVTVTSTSFSNNTGSGNSVVTGIRASGTLTVTGASFTNNKISAAGPIAGIRCSGTATVTDSTFSYNTASGNTVIAGVAASGTLTVTGALVTYNKISGTGPIAGISNSGAATVTASTFSLNTTTGTVPVAGINNSGIVTITATTFSLNTATGTVAVAGISNGSSGTATVTSTIFDSNASNGTAGMSNTGKLSVVAADFSKNAAGGSVINNSNGTLSVTDSTLSNNPSMAINNSSTMMLSNNTIANNLPTGSQLAGGIANTGALTLLNCTIANNTANGNNRAGGIRNTGTLSLTNCTLANNTASGSGSANGILNTSTGKSQLSNTIVTNQKGGELVGTFTGSNNIIGHGPISGLTSTLIADPLLGALGNYGGPTQTIALLPGSPAIDAGSSTIALDQRGLPRVGLPDIGAFESQGFAFTTTGSGQTAKINTAFANPLVVTMVANNPVEPVNGGTVTVTFTPPALGASASLSSSTVTIAGGKASVTAIANGIVGAYNVAATSGATSANFTLANAGPANASYSQMSGGKLIATFDNHSNYIEVIGQSGAISVWSNYTLVGTFNASAGITINCGSGNDTVAITVNAGQAFPTSVIINAGNGNDRVVVGSTAGTPGKVANLTMNLGAGDNQVVDQGIQVINNWTITAGAGNDTVGPLTSPVGSKLVMSLGDGSNTATVQSQIGSQLRYTGGSGADNLTLGGLNSYYLYALMNAGNDTVTFQPGSSIGSGFINFGPGADTYVPNGVFVGSGLTNVNLP